MPDRQGGELIVAAFVGGSGAGDVGFDQGGLHVGMRDHGTRGIFYGAAKSAGGLSKGRRGIDERSKDKPPGPEKKLQPNTRLIPDKPGGRDTLCRPTK